MLPGALPNFHFFTEDKETVKKRNSPEAPRPGRRLGLIPADTRLSFNLDLTNPFVVDYLQNALASGRLRLMFSSLHPASREGTPNYPSFYTKENIVGGELPTLRIEGTIVRPGDLDADGMADDWEQHYFGNLSATSAADSDHDGASNLAELRAGTDPTDSQSVLQFRSITRSPRKTTLTFVPTAGRRYVIEHSTDLKAWTTVSEPVLTYPSPQVAQWEDTAAANFRFYRIRLK